MRIVGLTEDPRTLVKDISVGKQQLIEIAKALAKNVKLLILDEPTSSLNESDSRHVLDLLLRLQKEQGITSIIILINLMKYLIAPIELPFYVMVQLWKR